jgi:hypothetical protein
MLSGGCEGDQMSSLMVGEIWSHVSHSLVSCLSNFKDCWFPNRDWKDLFLGYNPHQFEKMSFIIIKLRLINFCEQKLAQWL